MKNSSFQEDVENSADKSAELKIPFYFLCLRPLQCLFHEGKDFTQLVHCFSPVSRGEPARGGHSAEFFIE